MTTAPPVLQTDEASVGQTIGTQAVNDLPLNGRNFTFLAQLGAGTQTPQATRAATPRREHFRRMDCVRRRTTTCSMESTITPTR